MSGLILLQNFQREDELKDLLPHIYHESKSANGTTMGSGRHAIKFVLDLPSMSRCGEYGVEFVRLAINPEKLQ
jgi:hypothetical protein